MKATVRIGSRWAVIAAVIAAALSACGSSESSSPARASTPSTATAPTSSATPTATAPAMTQELIYTGQSDSGQPTGAISAHASGYCWEGSAAAPRADAWRCFEGNDILDPCFGSVGGPV